MTQEELNNKIDLLRGEIVQTGNDIDDYHIDNRNNLIGLLDLVGAIGNLVVGDKPASGRINPLTKPGIRARIKVMAGKCEKALEGNLQDAEIALDQIRNACEVTLLEIDNDRPTVAVIERDTVIRWMREIKKYLDSQKHVVGGNFATGDLQNIERVVNEALEEL